jgi:hypothetical protein
MPDENPTSDRLRDAIDRGEGGDKVNFSDPAAAPLGTDDEAAGTPPTEAQLRRAHEAEIEHPARERAAEPDRERRTPGALQPGGTPLRFAGLGVLAAVVLIAAVILLAV